jgi:hypothetical protein
MLFAHEEMELLPLEDAKEAISSSTLHLSFITFSEMKLSQHGPPVKRADKKSRRVFSFETLTK